MKTKIWLMLDDKGKNVTRSHGYVTKIVSRIVSKNQFWAQPHGRTIVLQGLCKVLCD